MSGGIIGKVSESNNTHLISNTFYAVSTTAANTATKVAKLVDTSINSITLIEGMLLIVRFAYANTANLPSLKIQSSSGTDLTNGIMIKGVSVDDTWVGTIPIAEWTDNGVVTLLYDGTYWVQTQGHDSDENVRQSLIGDNAAYDVLLAGTTGDSTVTTEVYKNNNFNYNPSTNMLSVGGISASSTITVGAAPTADMQVATKKYVDDQMGQAGLGTVTSITAGDGLTTGAAGTSGGTITTSGTIRHTNSATKMTPLDSEYNDALLYPVLLDATGHVRKYKDGIDPADFGIVTVDGITGDIISRWAQCTLAANVANKTATIQNGTLEALLTGTRVTVSFLNGSDANNPTLNINGTGAYNIYYNGYQLTELILPAGAAIDFAFDGTNWIVINYDYSSVIDDLWDALPHVTSDYSSTGTDAVNGVAVNKALQTLDSSITATSGQAISAVTITDGKITGSTKIDVGAPKATWYGTCSTTASTAEKAVTCSGFDFTSGAIIGILFSTANTAATPTLNVNSKGAKSIYIGASTPSSTTNVLKWSANTMVYFMYDGTYFRYITSVSAGSVVPSRGANTWYGTSSTGATTQAKTSTIDNFVLTKGAIVCIAFSTANTYTSAKITLNINSTGAKDVYYNNAVTSSTNTLLWDAGETVTFIYNGSYYYFVCKSKGGTVSDVQINNTSILSNGVANIITNSAYDSSTNKIATMSDITDSDKVFVVNVTLTSLTGGTSDKSSTDIYDAARAGKMVIAKVPYNGVQMVAVLVAAARDTSDDIAVFQYQNQKPSGLLSTFGFAKLTIVMNTVTIETAAAQAASLGGTYLYSGGAANDGITLAAEDGIDIDYLSQAPLSNGNVYTLRHTNAVSATTGSAAVYPITIDAQGHISSYGSAVTIPAAVAVKGNAESSYRTGNVNLTPANLGISATTSSVTVGSTTFTNTDTMVTNTASNTTKYYVTGTSSSSTNTGTQYFDTGIYATTTAGQLNATTYKVNENVTLQWNATDQSLDFIF